MQIVETGPVAFGNDIPLTVIARPCQLEGRDHALMIARAMAEAWAPWRAVAARLLWSYYRVAKEREGIR